MNNKSKWFYWVDCKINELAGIHILSLMLVFKVEVRTLTKKKKNSWAERRIKFYIIKQVVWLRLRFSCTVRKPTLKTSGPDSKPI